MWGIWEFNDLKDWGYRRELMEAFEGWVESRESIEFGVRH